MSTTRYDLNPEQFKQVTADLVAFVHRVTSGDVAPAEMAALPEIVKVLLSLKRDC